MQRRMILGELQKITSHPTAAKHYEVVKMILQNINLDKVYRIWELVMQSGVVRKLNRHSHQLEFPGMFPAYGGASEGLS